MYFSAQHKGQRGEGLGVPRHVPNDFGESGGSGARLYLLLRRRRLVGQSQDGPPRDAGQGESKKEGLLLSALGNWYSFRGDRSFVDPARLQDAGGRGELAALRGAVPAAVVGTVDGHV